MKEISGSVWSLFVVLFCSVVLLMNSYELLSLLYHNYGVFLVEFGQLVCLLPAVWNLDLWTRFFFFVSCTFSIRIGLFS